MKALIVDDEPLARRELRQLLAAHGVFSSISEAGDVREALEFTRHHSPAVVFLDVQLRGETGFDYVERLSAPAPQLVFVTAYDDYAIKAFECAALDYLLKPVDQARLAATVGRIAARAAAPAASPAGMAVLKVGAQLKLVAWADLLRISTEGNYTRVYLRDGGTVLILRTLKEWQTLVPPGDFLQVHRTCLVRRGDIAEVRLNGSGDRELVLSDGSVVPVGRLYWGDLKQILLPH